MAARVASIVGGGIGGMTTALALLRSGWRVRVYEQTEELGEVGAGLSISPGAAAGLASLGLEAALMRASLPVTSLKFAHFQSGEVLSTGAAPVAGESDSRVPRHIHRADLHALLVEAVRRMEPGAVLLGRRLTRIEQGARVVAHFTDGSREESDMLIAADGVRSAARRELFGDGAPRFAGQVAFRCLIPRVSALPFMRAGTAVVSIGAGRVFHRYLIRNGSLVNVIGIAQSDAWPHEGWNTPASADEFLTLYHDFHPDVTGLIRLASAETLIKWGLFVREPLDRWSVGRVALLGDAAHPILPFLGLGAALAIEDAIVVARALEVTPQIEVALRIYHATRAERVARVRLASIRQGELIQASDVTRKSLQPAPAGDEALFDFDPCRVPLRRVKAVAGGRAGEH